MPFQISTASSQPSSPARSSGPSIRESSSSSCSASARRVRPRARRCRSCSCSCCRPPSLSRRTTVDATAHRGPPHRANHPTAAPASVGSSDPADVRRARARRRTRSPRRASDTRSLAKMLLTWRATVFSLMTSSAAIARLVLPGRDQAQHLQLARRQAVRVAGRGRRERLDAGEVGHGAELLRRRRAPPRAPARRRPRRRGARQARPSSTRTRAASYGTSSSCHGCHARRSAVSAARASPSASSTAPCACAAIARSSGSSTPAASSSSSSQAARAARDVAGGEHDLDVRGQQTPRAAADPAPRRAPGGSRPPRRPRGPGEAQQRQPRLRLPPARGWPRGTPPRPPRTRRAAGGARPAGRTPRRRRRFGAPRSERSPARRASSSASGHAPCNCMISARCTRHDAGEGTRSGCCSHQWRQRRVHSCARRSS